MGGEGADLPEGGAELELLVRWLPGTKTSSYLLKQAESCLGQTAQSVCFLLQHLSVDVVPADALKGPFVSDTLKTELD